MTVAHRVETDAYRRAAAAGGYERTELRNGVPVEKPAVSVGHVRIIDRLARTLIRSLDPDAFVVSTGGSRLRMGPQGFAIPDLVVLPAAAEARLFAGDPLGLAVYDDPVLLVVEVWSPSTGGYDVNGKLPGYRSRGDDEIWRLHPIERSLMRWIRGTDGSYVEESGLGGTITLATLPEIAVDLDALFG